MYVLGAMRSERKESYFLGPRVGENGFKGALETLDGLRERSN